METSEIEKIKQMVEKAYILGIHTDQNIEKIGQGFHENFHMLVLQENQIITVGIQEWMEKIEMMKLDNPKLWEAKTTATIKVLDITGPAATVKILVQKGDVKFSTDYMMLYKIGREWKIVSKIFTTE